MAAVRLRRVKEDYGDAIAVRWRSYPLAVQPRPEARISAHSVEGRHRAALEEEGIRFNPWPDGMPYPVTSMPALRVSVCARLQGEEAFERLHLLIFKTFFEECRNIQDNALLMDLAKQAGLDMRRFRADLRKAEVDEEILADHRYYQEDFLGFGIPLAIVADRYPLVGTVPIEMYRRAIDLSLGRVKRGS